MKTLNQLIEEYTYILRQGEIQTAYKAILEFIGKLRADVIKKYPDYETGSLYQGYMNMTYFSLSTKLLKEKGLKLAIVYLHSKGVFEVWLSARNRDIAKRYEYILNSNISDNISVFHDDFNQDALIEYTLTSTPNFDKQATLIEIIEQGIDKFLIAVNSHL
ncbi:MAG: hypothetical protein AB9844_03160 [Clostridiaceae bacterium]